LEVVFLLDRMIGHAAYRNIDGGHLRSLGGRWVQLYPERLVPKGHFVGPDTRGARFYRTQMAFLGTFMVVAGTCGAVLSLISLLRLAPGLVTFIATLVGLAAGIAAAAHVRREAKTRPPYISNNPYGWWP
jgi:hypothetical protein